MLKPIQTIIGYVFEHIEEASVARRIELYRALACVAVSKQEAANYNAIADSLVAIEARHQQLVLDFKRRDLQS